MIHAYLETSSSARNTESHRTSVPNMRVVTLTEKLDDPWHLLRVAEEEEAESRDG